jgi:Protein of unknown function (DUF1579)
MALSTPPLEIEILQEDVGVWRAEVEVRPGPDAPVQRSEGAMSCRMCGRWLVTDFKNETSGFEGHGITGWDSILRRYVATWVDPMRKGLVVMQGAWDAEGRTMTFVGEMSRPDGSRLRWREVTEKPDANTRIFRSFVPAPSGELEVMTVRYERAG